MIILDMLEPYLQELLARNYSQETIHRRTYSLRSFIRFLGLREVVLVDQLNVDVLEEYKHDLTFRHTDQNKSKKLSAQTRRGYLSVVRSFCGYLHSQDLLVNNPAADLAMPKIPRRLPRGILTFAEIRKLIDACDMTDNRGYRNRIIIEILYDTGVRGSELCRINCDDLDLAVAFSTSKAVKETKTEWCRSQAGSVTLSGATRCLSAPPSQEAMTVAHLSSTGMEKCSTTRGYSRSSRYVLKRQGLRRISPAMPFDMPAPPICCKTVPMSGLSRSCSATTLSIPPRYTPG